MDKEQANESNIEEQTELEDLTNSNAVDKNNVGKVHTLFLYN